MIMLLLLFPLFLSLSLYISVIEDDHVATTTTTTTTQIITNQTQKELQLVAVELLN
jgi:hypothetical protein